jgi:hypothetical protein
MDYQKIFDFDFEGTSRQDLLQQAYETVAGLSDYLGSENTDKTKSSAQIQAEELLDRLSQQIAQFADSPEVYQLEEKDFANYDLPIPEKLEQILKENRIYWIHFPIILHSQEDRAFNKIKVAVEFNPGESHNHLRPRVLTILPNKKFRDRLATTGEAKAGIGTNIEFDVQTGPIELPIPNSRRSLKVGNLGILSVEDVAKLGLVVFPFEYKLRAREIDHSDAHAEQVYWTVIGDKFFQDNRPEFVVLLQVPNQVKKLKIAAALQAYSKVILDDNLIEYLTRKVASFFKAGAPIQDIKTPDDWDITKRLD